MRIRHLILMLLEACSGSMESKTKLQKAMYFVSLILDRNMGYKAHYYGPYSAEVDNALDELIGAGFIEEERVLCGVDYRYGFEIKKYKFHIRESGRKLAKGLAEENATEYYEIEEFVEKLKEIGDPDYLSLSIAAKACFILTKEGKPMTKAQIIDKAKKFGWNVKDEDIEKAVKILKELGFAEEK